MLVKNNSDNDLILNDSTIESFEHVGDTIEIRTISGTLHVIEFTKCIWDSLLAKYNTI